MVRMLNTRSGEVSIFRTSVKRLRDEEEKEVKERTKRKPSEKARKKLGAMLKRRLRDDP